MWSWLNTLLILADDTLQRVPVDPGEAAKQNENPWGGLLTIMLPALAFMLLVQMMLKRGESGESKRRTDQIAALKKNDPIVTSGGIKGTFVSASQDKSEITIKIDDNTRMKIEAWAIRDFPKSSSSEEPAKS
ncbi:MAG: preprotein translocase subunit YajC [Planctomycetaceae bacterium]|nr:preprotein translocase subunit YajC [Planctomycetaceae bacterium]